MTYLLTYSSFNAKRHAIANTDSIIKLHEWIYSKGYIIKDTNLFYNKDNHSYMEVELVKTIDI